MTTFSNQDYLHALSLAVAQQNLTAEQIVRNTHTFTVGAARWKPFDTLSEEEQQMWRDLTYADIDTPTFKRAMKKLGELYPDRRGR